MNIHDHIKIPSLKEVKSIIGSIQGAEGGYTARVDAIESVAGTGTTIDGQPLNDIWTDLNQRLALFNQQANRMVGLLVYPTTRAQDRVAVPFTPAFEDASEFGRPGKARFSYVFRGFPLTHKDLGIRGKGRRSSLN